MTLRISDPLFLLSAQTGLSARELSVKAAQGNPDVDQPQSALKTGEPIPIIFCRRNLHRANLILAFSIVNLDRSANSMALLKT